ncbi:MAG TPA: glycosyltransferase [Kofleriaceae bacterium]|jgi:glycosyltransferase involved in cell wall biosynthesis
MHVLHVIDGLGLGGAERMAVDIANATVADGHRVSFCVTRDVTTLVPHLDPGIELLVLARRSKIDIRATAKLVRFVQSNPVDVIHVHMRSVFAYVSLLRIVRALRAPIIFHDHFGATDAHTHVPLWFRVGARLLSHYVGVYPPLRDWAISAGVPPERASVIENALDLRRISGAPKHDLRSELGLAPEIQLGILVATIRHVKGIDILLDAVTRCRTRAKFHIAIAGAYGEPEYAAEIQARLARDPRLSGVTLLGGRMDVPSLLHDADFALLTSRSESGPLVLIEYLAAGLAIVATRVGDIGRRLEGSGIAGFVNPKDPAELAAAIDDLVELPVADRRIRAEAGRAVIDAQWSIATVIKRWYALYDSAIRS